MNRVVILLIYEGITFIYKTLFLWYCRVSVFGLGPLQWICIEWVQKLGSDEATACFGGEKYTESDGPTFQGERTPRPRTGNPNFSRIPWASLLSLGLLPPFFFSLGDLCCYISNLLFILLLHLSVIHAHIRVHVPSAIPSGALWAAVAPIACPRVTSTSMGSGC